ncbi:hypothetical protein CPB84DRAFT_1965111 [Gymnopilus junonius]|uniref:Uncharacterized protein n=1 Tax=Gymnopilus junonius TaxID=109634 RepID=A0A9P5NDK8_GYMJU|nr:hypothetical protein CPB84DRAFT_1965111 [Gymnopilus junonius]
MIIFLPLKCIFKIWRMRIHLKVESPVFIKPLVKCSFPKTPDTRKTKKVLISDVTSDIGFYLFCHYSRDPDAEVTACVAFQFGPRKGFTGDDLWDPVEMSYLEHTSRAPILHFESLHYDKPPQYVKGTIDYLDRTYGPFAYFYEVSALGEDFRYNLACDIYRYGLGTSTPKHNEPWEKLPEMRKQILPGREAAIEEMTKLMKTRGRAKFTF